MSRTALLVALLLVLTACAGDDPVVEAPEVSATPEVVATETVDVGGLDASLLATLESCADGDAAQCEAAAATLSDDDLDVIIGLCTEGQEEYCSILETLFGETDPVEEEPTGYADALDALEEGEERAAGAVVLDGSGAEVQGAVVTFGEDADDTVAAFTAALGDPADDTGYIATGDGSGCPGEQYRFVTWAEMTITILDDSRHATGAPHFAAWQTTGPTVSAQSFVGDTTLVPIDVGLTRVLDLREAIPAGSLRIQDEAPLGASFLIEDNLGDLFGELSTTEDSGVVQSVSSGGGCGE